MVKIKLGVATVAMCALYLVASPGLTVSGQSGGGTKGGIEASTAGPNFVIGPQVPLSEFFRMDVKGDYVSAGVGMRNIGNGTINIGLPAGSSIVKAFLYWAFINPSSSPNGGTLNGTGITGTLVGSSGSPCWSGTLIHIYRADVTGIAVNGANALSGFPSGLTNNAPPQTAAVIPLLEGASLVVIFQNPLYDFNTVVIREGAQTFALQSVATSFGSFTAASATPADQIAQTTYIVADGQSRAPNDRASFNSTFVAGPGTGLKPADAFDGADGIAPVFPLDGLWDTLNVDVSSFFTPAIATAGSADVDGSLGGDCLTWLAQVLSVKTTLMAAVDIKPTSCPNPLNTRSQGVIPVAIVGTATFDVTQVDVSTVRLEGVAPLRSSVADVATPFVQNQSTCTDCTTQGADGIPDLVLHFDTQAIVAALGSVTNGQCRVLTLTGNLLNGVPFRGSDIMRIQVR